MQGCELLGLNPSFGFGDRIGLATPGHVHAMKQRDFGIAPIFPQQSIREMTRTGRTPEQVMSDALSGARNAGWTGPIGADADHLKTEQDVDQTVAAGFTFFTIDPSDSVDQQADNYDEAALRLRFMEVRHLASWFDEYSGKTVNLAGGTRFELDEESVMRAAVKYGQAIHRAIELGNHIARSCSTRDREYEIELSVDETDQPTSLAEHFIIADQCLKGGMKLVSLAPRFPGDLEKGVDYKGDRERLESVLDKHAAIARHLGPYKLSLHSGSDKLSMYSMLARATCGLFHVKTAGTSYLEALRVVARHDAGLFREIIRFARDHYNRDKATYHVSATLESVPSEAELTDDQLESRYLEHWEQVPQGKGFTQPGRQILHCTFGSLLTHERLGVDVLNVLRAHPDSYQSVLTEHFSRHLSALGVGM